MDENMTQVLAERLGFTKEQNAALQAGDLASLFLSRSSDPLMAALVSSVLNKKSTKNEESEPQLDYERELVRSKRIIRKLKEDLAAADMMLKYIAEIFGTCPACWGQNKLCLRCKGNGRPGSADPAEEELLAWVEPALKKLGMGLVNLEHIRGTRGTAGVQRWDLDKP